MVGVVCLLWSVAWLEARRFFEDQCLEGLFGQVVKLHVEFERSLGDRLVKKKKQQQQHNEGD